MSRKCNTRFYILIFSALSALNVFGQVSVSFTTTNNSGCGSLSTSFCSTSTSSAGAINSYSWDICGVTSTLECPGAILTNSGGCTVCLTVTDDVGNTNTLCENDFVIVNDNPQPQFSANNTSGCIPHNVTFSDQTIIGSAPIVQWTWDIGGSAGVIITTDPNEIISTTYSIADSYGVSLTVEDANGCTETTFIDNYIEAIDVPSVTFSADQVDGCSAPFEVQFTNTTFEPSYSYSWDFGNGQTFNGENPPLVNYTDQGFYTVTLSATSAALGCTTHTTEVDFITIGSLVSFTASAYESCLGEAIVFEDTSSEPADSIRWVFGNGVSSTEANPSVTYDAEGCYTVSLVRFIDGCTGIETYDCIDILNTIDIDYTLINPNGCQAPHTVTFSNQTAGVNSYVWEVLDEAGAVISTYTLPNSTHTFTDFGMYPIRLTAVNAGGCSGSEIIDSVNIQPLTASIPMEIFEGCAPYSFTISDNTITNSPITSWNWELITENGTINSTSMAPTFTLIDTGCADIKLTVLNAEGCSSTQTFENAACAGTGPVIDFVADPLSTCAEVAINFTAISDSEVTTYSWDFEGDGVFDTDGNPVVHEYQDTGYFDVILMAEHNGCISTILKEDYIHITPPVAIFYTGNNCNNTLNVTFLNNSVGADSLVWTITLPTGDEVFPYDLPNYLFPDFGSYPVTLEVFNNESNCSDIITKTITITDNQAIFSAANLSGCAPFTLELLNESIGMDSFLWVSTVGEIVDPAIQDAEITFTEPGIYAGDEIKLITFDNQGCADSITLDGDIIVNRISPKFIVEPNEGCAPLTVTFTDASTNLYGTNTSWSWNMDGLATLEGQQVSFTFEESGSYDISFTVIDDIGCNGSIAYADTVIVVGPNANFNADSIICTAADFTFENTTLGTDNIYFWDFGNGTTSTDETPTLNFDIEGAYTVCLTASNALGCSSTNCQDIIVSDPVADFTADNTYAFCPPLVVTFANSSTGAFNYEWDFGDGTGTSNLENPAHVYTSPGNYDVRLVVYNSPECADTLIFTNYINIDGPIGQFDIVVDGQCNPVNVEFTGSSQFAYNFVWDFGNGEVDSTLLVNNDIVNYTYDVPGIYIPKLILVDDAGCENVFTGDSIVVAEMSAIFTSEDTVICNQITPVTLTSISESLYPITDYHWYIPGGTPDEAFGESVEINFSNPGPYPVTLVIENEFCKDSVTIVDYIRIGSSPTAEFTTQDSIVCYPDSIFFIDQSTGNIVSWEWNFEDGSTSSTQNPIQSFMPQNDISAQLLVENDIGCQDSITHTVDVLPAIDASVEDEYEICKNDQIQLVAEVTSAPNITFSWQSSPHLSCTDCLTPIANPTSTTTFYFTVTNANVCETTYPVVVNVLQDSIPNINITGPTSICLNEVTQLNATGGEGPFAYQWDESQPGLTCYTDCSNPVASPSVTTTYYLTVTNVSGCSAVDSITVNVNNEFMDIATEDQLLCEGDSVQLIVNEGINPVWFPGNGLSCVSCPNPIAFPTEDIVYTVTIETASGCSISDSVYIDVVGLDEIDAGDDITICYGEIGYLEGFGTGNISWTPNFLVNNDLTLTPEVSPLETTTYYMHVDNGSCILTDSVTVYVTTETNVYALDKAICAGEGVELAVVGEADTYQWTPETGLSLPMIQNPIANPTVSTTYQVIATNGTCDPDTAYVDVTVNSLPETDLPPIYYFYPGQTVSLYVSSNIQDKSNFLWLEPDGLSCIICDDPYLTGDTTATYNVVVRDPDSGCPDTLTTTLIPINECDGSLISVPNVFSPNGDDINDVVYPYSTIIDKVKTFKVFNRWGELLFEENDFATNAAGHGWDGKYRGKYMQPGVYIYYLEAICYSGDTVIKKGDITIFR